MNERTRNFQGLRLLLLFGIVFMHAGLKFIGTGWLMCTFFFILSGFFYRHPDNIFKYIKRKLLKVFPFYWICLFLTIFLRESVSLEGDVWKYILLIQSFFPSDSVELAFYRYLGPSWFLSSLLFCYIVSPFIYKLIKKIPKEGYILTLGLLVTAMVVVRGSDIVPKGYGIWAFYISPFFRVLEYTLGLLLRELIIDKEVRIVKHIDVVSIIVVTLMIIYLRASLTVLYVQVLFLVVIYYFYMYKSKLLDVVFGNHVVVYLAKFGIELYLAHQFLFAYFYYDLGMKVWPAVLLAIVLSFVLGISYSFIVQQIEKYKNALGKNVSVER